MKTYSIAALTGALILASGCSMNPAYHGGQIVEAQNESVSIYVGEAHGLGVGDVIRVYREIHTADDTGTDMYDKTFVGKLKLTKLADNEGFAQASIVEGDIEKHDIAKLAHHKKGKHTDNM